MADIEQIIADIRAAEQGGDVRETIAVGIENINEEMESTTAKQDYLEVIFDDLVINAGDENAEIVAARNGKGSLPARLAEDDANFANFKASTAETLGNMATLSDLQQVSLSYKESYATLALLQTVYPQGNINNHTVLADGFIYTYQNSTWLSTGIQANGTGIAYRSITPEKTSFMQVNKNKFDKTKAIIGQYINITAGEMKPNASFYASDFTPVIFSTNYALAKQSSSGSDIVFYDVNKAFISGQANIVNHTFSTPSNCVYIRFTTKIADINTQQIELGTVVTTFEPYKMGIGNSNISNKAVSTINLDEELEDKINEIGTIDARISKTSVSTNVYKDIVYGSEVYNGVIINENILTIPVGQTGVNSYIQSEYNLQEETIGKTIRVEIAFTTSSNVLDYITLSLKLSVVRNGINITRVENNAIITKITDNVYKAAAEYAVVDGDTTLKVALQVTEATGDLSTVREFTISDLLYYIISDSTNEKISTLQTLNTENLIKKVIEVKMTTKTIKADGTGDYNSILLALNDITDATSNNQYILKIYTGIYADANWHMKDYISLEGIDRDSCILYTELLASATDYEISQNQCFWWASTGYIKNLTIKCKNSRYPIHAESNGVNIDKEQNIYNCIIEHLGNQEVIDYRIAQSQSYSSVWKPTAWGCGMSSGGKIEAWNTTFKGSSYAFYFHTRDDFKNPNRIKLNNCKVINSGNGNAIGADPLGSKTNDILEINNCEIIGGLLSQDIPWIYSNIDYQPSNHNEIKIFGCGNTPVLYKNNYSSRALCVMSNTQTNSKVRITGTALSMIFGELITKDGCNGINGYSYGSVDVAERGVGMSSDVFITSIGKRLGNCSSANKSLTVNVDSLTPVTIMFDIDYTNVSNTIILASINSALVGAVASLFDVGSLYYPNFQDQELILTNSSNVGIKKGMVVSYNTSYRNIRLMKNTDLESDFVGIALEDIVINAMGRIKTKGKVSNVQVILKTVTTPNFKDTYGISDVDGILEKNMALKLLNCIETNVLNF